MGKVVTFLKNDRIVFILIVGIIAGILLIVFDKSSSLPKNDVTATYTDDQLYSRELEKRLEDILNEIQGVSDVKVMITVTGTSESVFASDGDRQKDKHVVTDGGLVCVKKILPSIEGVAVVCNGGNDACVKEKITSLVCSLLGVYSNHVYVTE